MAEHPPHPAHLLHRLLGPPGHDIGCEECFALLDLYVEAELAGHHAEHHAPGMHTHLAGCPACAEEHHSLHTLLTTLSPPAHQPHR